MRFIAIERGFTWFAHSRPMAILLTVAVCVVMIVRFPELSMVHVIANKGIALHIADTWIDHGYLSLFVNLLLNIAILAMMVYINQRFNVLRNITMIYASLFIIFQLAFPDLLCQFYSGTLLCLVVMLCTIMLFSSYRNRDSAQRVTFVFILLTLGALTQYAFILYIVVFLIGCGQMHILNLKMTLAAVIGIITPLWILYGFGIVSLGDFRVPEFVNILATMEPNEVLQIVLSFGITAFICVVSMVFNIMRIMGYNAHTRELNSFLFLLSFVTLLMALIDYTNMITYIPLLNCCTAFQLGHLFVLGDEARRGYVGMFLTIFVYVGLYLMDLWL